MSAASIRRWSIAFAVGVAGLMAIVLAPAGQSAEAAPLQAPSTVAATAADKCTKSFFGLKPWYYYLPDSAIGVGRIGKAPVDECGIKCFNIFVQNAPNACGTTKSDVPGVILAIIDDLLRISALVAVAFVLIGSFQFVGSRGNSERTSNAQTTIINALTGLAIALVAVALVSFIGARLN